MAENDDITSEDVAITTESNVLTLENKTIISKKDASLTPGKKRGC